MFLLQIFGASTFGRGNLTPQPVPQPVVVQQEQPQPTSPPVLTSSSQPRESRGVYFTIVDALRPTVNFVFGSGNRSRSRGPLR